jgi:2-oxoglutarate dehydrogenase E2 component (dihydrolipoamide succinyltransferase)
MSIAVELPSLGESVFEGTVARWLVSEGEMVEVDQPIVEVTTDKVDAEIPAPCAGMLEQILVAEGDVIEIGAVLARIDPDAKADTPSGGAPANVPQPVTSREAPVEGIAATPVARRMADEASIDLRDVQGTGSAGRVTKEDILRHSTGSSPATIADAPEGQTATPRTPAPPALPNST